MLNHIWKSAIIVLAAVIVVVLIIRFWQPHEAETITTNFEAPGGVEVQHTTSFSCADGKLSLKEFYATPRSEDRLMVHFNETSAVKLFLVANNSANTCVKTEIARIEPGYGQSIDRYEINTDKGEMVAEMVSNRDGPGPERAKWLTPITIYMIAGLTAFVWAVVFWFILYQNVWRE